MTASDTTDKGLDLLEVYRQMLTIRRLEERILDLHRQGHIDGSVHLCVGQEVVPTIILRFLDDRDRVQATYRGHGWALASGVSPESLLSEVLGRATGMNGGRAGSAYLTSPMHGFIGENSIVGAGAPIANGIGMGLAAQQLGGVSVVSFGDGATNQGSVHEAIVFAVARKLPVIFVCENNSWSEMTPISNTVPNVSLRDRASGYGLLSEAVEGNDIEALMHASASVIGRARAGDGPGFLEVRVPRLLGHYNRDIEHYRSEEDKENHRRRDPLGAVTKILEAERGLNQADFDEIESQVRATVDDAERYALESPFPDPTTARDHVTARARISPVAALPTEGDELAYGLAVNRALEVELERRPDMVCFGEDIAVPGGTFGVTRNLRKKFGDRVFDTPISEAAILGAALGGSLEGLKPVVEIMWSDFLLVAFDQVVNQMANVRYISRGEVSAPIVVRMQQGITPGSCAQHSQSLEALIAHIPGIRIGMPSTPHDAFAMLRSAIDDPDPVIIIESRALYLDKGPVDIAAPVETVGGARLRRPGSDVSIISWGRMANLCVDAAECLESVGISAAVLDLRWLNPFDEAAVVSLIAETGGKAVIVHEANVTGGFGAEIAARLGDRHFGLLVAPLLRLGLPDVRVPASSVLQAAVMPGIDSIYKAVTETAAFTL